MSRIALCAALAVLCGGSVSAPSASDASRAVCSCMGSRTEREAVAQSDAVFTGRVVWVRTVDDPPYGQAREATFLVGGWIKGGRAATVRVRTSLSSCGVTFRVGRTHRIYAGRPPGQPGAPLYTHSCSGPMPRVDPPTAFRASSRLSASPCATWG